jgi:hypothetical protein
MPRLLPTGDAARGEQALEVTDCHLHAIVERCLDGVAGRDAMWASNADE